MNEPTWVAPGTQVEVELIDQQGDAEQLSFALVADDAADFDNGLLGVGTPLAQALLGQRVGAQVDYRRGGLRQVRIIGLTWRREETAASPASAAERRQAVLERALQDSDRTNALNFASSFSGKWGDYDPAGVEAWTGPAHDQEE
jgi:hypothetical protein